MFEHNCICKYAYLFLYLYISFLAVMSCVVHRDATPLPRSRRAHRGARNDLAPSASTHSYATPLLQDKYKYKCNWKYNHKHHSAIKIQLKVQQQISSASTPNKQDCWALKLKSQMFFLALQLADYPAMPLYLYLDKSKYGQSTGLTNPNISTGLQYKFVWSSP